MIFVGYDSFCPFPSDVMTFYPHDKDCHKFYECYGGHKYELDCPSNLYWNQTATTCDYQCGKYCTNIRRCCLIIKFNKIV